MEAQLRTLMGECAVKRGEAFTHTTKDTDTWYPGCYYVPSEYYEKFMRLYSECVMLDCKLPISEKPGPYTPLRVDFDFKTDLDMGLKRVYSKEMLREIVGFFQKEIRRIVRKDDFDEKLLYCIVLEKSAPRSEEGSCKDGFHLHFPHFITVDWIIDTHLPEVVTKAMVQNGTWSKIKLITKIEKLIDTPISRKTWMMYGSMNYKNIKSEPYKYKRIRGGLNNRGKSLGYAFDHKLREIPLKKVFKEEMIGREKDVEYYLPLFFSIRGYQNEGTRLNSEVDAKRIMNSKRNKRRRVRVAKKRSLEAILKDIKLIKDANIMDMLSDDRSDFYDSWMDVGWTLFNIGEGHEEALNLWIEFSQRSTNFQEGRCEEEWYKMELKNKTLGSLLYMAKSDSPNMYREWREDNIRYWIWESLKEARPAELDVAKVAYKMFEGKFICADAKKGIWYEFRDHRWREMNGDVELKLVILEDVRQEYINYKVELARGEAESRGVERKECEEKEKRCIAIITALKSDSFVNRVVNLCKVYMHDSKFLKMMNENKTILVCENGVIDLELKTFRDGRPDDYATFSTGLYYTEYNNEDFEVKELDDYLRKVFPNNKRRAYFLDFICSCMKGGNIHKKILIETGGGDNGKSITTILLELTFGSGNDGYFGKFPRELIVKSSRGNSSSGARPELARVRGKRIMGFDEIAETETVDIGVLKLLTGNDSFFTRTLHDKGCEIKPMFTTVLQCNTPPAIPAQDKPTWSRIRVLDYESKFVQSQDLSKYPVPEDENEQFKKKRFHADPNFSDQLPDLASVLLWKLFRRYIDSYSEKGLVEPEEVKFSTARYQTENDIYQQFIESKIEKTDDLENFVRMNDMFAEFKSWYQENHPSYRREPISKPKMKKELIERLGEVNIESDRTEDKYGFGKLGRWWGYKLFHGDTGDIFENDGKAKITNLLKK